MERLSKSAGWILAACIGLAVGCDSGAGTTGSGSATAKSSGSNKPATTTKASASGGTTAGTTASAATTTSAAAMPSGSASAGEAKAVDIEDLAKGDASGDKGLLNVDLSKADQDAPALGGGEPPAVKGDAKLEWLPAGSVGLEIPNPGWKKSEAGEIGILASPSDKGGVVFAHFGTPEEGLKKVDELTAKLQLKNLKWAKPTEVVVGPDKLPGYAGGGKGEDEKGKPVKVFYALIKTGQPQNLLALGGADDGAEEEWKTALDIIDSIRKKK